MPNSEERLRILATSDVHMHMMAFDYYADANAPGIGLSALADTISGLRRTAQTAQNHRHVVLLDNGDLLQGTPLGDHLAANPDGIKSLGAVLKNLGYAAIGVGNHDLDYGIDHVSRLANLGGLPILSSNLTLDRDAAWPKPYMTLQCGDVCLGVISVLPPKTMDWTHPTLGGTIRITDMVESIRTAAAAVRAQGADLVVALAHTGIGPDPQENALSDIAKDGHVDALIGGHTHHAFPSETLKDHPGADVGQGTMHGVPTVMPGFGGALVGCIDIDAARTTDGRWEITQASACIVPARSTGPLCAPEVEALLPAHQATCRALDKIIGTAAAPLTSYFAQVAPSNMLALSAAAQYHAIDAARRGSPFAQLPLLSASAPPRAGGRGGAWNYSDIAIGDVKERNLADLLVFANSVWAVTMNGAEVITWLEHSASGFHQIDPNTSSDLLDATFPAFNFDTLFGLTYTVDPTQPVHRRIHDVRHNGAPVSDADQFLIAVNSYRACGGGDFPGLHTHRPVLRPKLPSANVLRDFIGSGQAADFPKPWRFSDNAKGVKCLLKTGPGALDHLDDIAHLSPGTPQLQNNGFVAIPITL